MSAYNAWRAGSIQNLSAALRPGCRTQPIDHNTTDVAVSCSMTESDWLTSTEPKALFKFLKCRLKHRKMRLFAVACCRRIAGQLADRRSLAAIDIAERHADGNASDRKLRLANEAASAAHRQAYDILAEKEEEERHKSGGPYVNEAKIVTCLDWAAVQVADPSAWKAAESVSWMAATPRHPGAVTGAEYPVQANLVREIFGSPFRPVVVQPCWLTWNSRSCKPWPARFMMNGPLNDCPNWPRCWKLPGARSQLYCTTSRNLESTFVAAGRSTFC